MLFVSAQKKADRLNICRACEHFVAKTKSCGPLVKEAFTDSPLCGCHMPTKTRFKTSSCPLGKWHALITKKDLKKIQAFLDSKDKTIEDLQELSNKFLRGTKVSTCPSCNRNMINELKAIIRNADT